MRRPSSLRLASAGLAAALALPLVAGPAVAQSGRTLAQMERQYPNMSPIHIEKCDRNGDGIFTSGEQACVSSMWDVLRDNR